MAPGSLLVPAGGFWGTQREFVCILNARVSLQSGNPPQRRVKEMGGVTVTVDDGDAEARRMLTVCQALC